MEKLLHPLFLRRYTPQYAHPEQLDREFLLHYVSTHRIATGADRTLTITGGDHHRRYRWCAYMYTFTTRPLSFSLSITGIRMPRQVSLFCKEQENQILANDLTKNLPLCGGMFFRVENVTPLNTFPRTRTSRSTSQDLLRFMTRDRLRPAVDSTEN